MLYQNRHNFKCSTRTFNSTVKAMRVHRALRPSNHSMTVFNPFPSLVPFEPTEIHAHGFDRKWICWGRYCEKRRTPESVRRLSVAIASFPWKRMGAEGIRAPTSLCLYKFLIQKLKVQLKAVFKRVKCSESRKCSSRLGHSSANNNRDVRSLIPGIGISNFT